MTKVYKRLFVKMRVNWMAAKSLWLFPILLEEVEEDVVVEGADVVAVMDAEVVMDVEVDTEVIVVMVTVEVDMEETVVVTVAEDTEEIVVVMEETAVEEIAIMVTALAIGASLTNSALIKSIVWHLYVIYSYLSCVSDNVHRSRQHRYRTC